MKIYTLGILAAGLFAASAAFAEDKACCAGMTASNGKQACSATFANLDLNAEQKAEMEKLAGDCDKAGCNKESMARMEKSAKGILSKDQFAAWKAACTGMMSSKTQS